MAQHTVAPEKTSQSTIEECLKNAWPVRKICKTYHVSPNRVTKIRKVYQMKIDDNTKNMNNVIRETHIDMQGIILANELFGLRDKWSCFKKNRTAYLLLTKVCLKLTELSKKHDC